MESSHTAIEDRTGVCVNASKRILFRRTTIPDLDNKEVSLAMSSL